jgi:fructosamine-3-kinase
MIPREVQDWFKNNNFGEITSSHQIGGGCINNGVRIYTSSEKSFFLKVNSQAPADMFALEVDGLEALDVLGGPKVPKSFLFSNSYLLLEDLEPTSHRSDYWVIFGKQLATLHKHHNPHFGFNRGNYIGSTPQPNPWTSDGYAFFAEHRLLFQANLAHQRGLFNNLEVKRVENLVMRLPELIPVQPASLIHGDLWSGNAMTDRDGGPAIIDPAAHFGWAEAELAMTTLFGTFPDAFYSSYQDINPLVPGFKQRFPLYNLYHLLNHVNLFGGGYLGQVNSILKSF